VMLGYRLGRRLRARRAVADGAALAITVEDQRSDTRPPASEWTLDRGHRRLPAPPGGRRRQAASKPPSGQLTDASGWYAAASSSASLCRT
jgi:hypothetical protein